MAARYKEVFPEGMRNASLADFTEPPKSGVLISNSNDLLVHVGMKPSDIIVALDGKRVDTFEQYDLVRLLTDSPEMNFIIYSDGKYRATHARIPGRRFDLQFVTYHP